MVAEFAGGRSTSVIIAASRPRLRTSCNPTCKELNCPRAGSGLTTIDAPSAYATGATAASFLPATTMMKSVENESDRMAAERKVPLDGGWPGVVGGQGSRALSAPMRDDSPAARITPAKLGARDMPRTIAERRKNVSEPKRRCRNEDQRLGSPSSIEFSIVSLIASAAGSELSSGFSRMVLNQLIWGSPAGECRRIAINSAVMATA